MKPTPPKDSYKEKFLENRTSWEFFERIRKANNIDFNLYSGDLLLEILKELQFMNDKK